MRVTPLGAPAVVVIALLSVSSSIARSMSSALATPCSSIRMASAPIATPKPNAVPTDPKEPPKTMPPLAPAAISDEKLAAAPAKPPESKRRVSESTLQVDNVEDLLVSMPSLLATLCEIDRTVKSRPFEESTP